MIGALMAIVGCQIAGEGMVRLFHWPIPGPVVGLIVLLTALVVRGSVPPSLDRLAGTLLGHLSLLFIPASVGIVAHLDLLSTALWPVVTVVTVGTALTLLVTAWLAERLHRRFRSDRTEP